MLYILLYKILSIDRTYFELLFIIYNNKFIYILIIYGLFNIFIYFLKLKKVYTY